MNARRIVRAMAAAAAIATVITLAPAANAETTRIDDGADATASTTDIGVVRVTHADHRVRIQVRFPDLREDGNAGLMTWIDTDREQKGPEYAIAAPLFSGGEYVLIRSDGWKPMGQLVDCRYNLQLDYAEDKLVLTARRGCLDQPDQIRVGMRMVDYEDDSQPVTDWLLGRRQLTSWLSPGDAA